jgi:hypothetical protein
MAATCSDKLSEIGPDCVAACMAQTKWDLDCRRQHCTNATKSDPQDHCQHAVGKGAFCADMQ